MSLSHWPGTHTDNAARLLVALGSWHWCAKWQRKQGLRHSHNTLSDEVDNAFGGEGPTLSGCC